MSKDAKAKEAKAKANYLEHGVYGKPTEREELVKERNRVAAAIDRYKKEAMKRDAREAASAPKPPMKRGGKVKKAKAKSRPKAISQKQAVHVNVKNIVQMLRERKQPSMIQVQRKPPSRNLMMGSRTLMASPHINYGNAMPTFLPVQERQAVIAPQDPIVSNPVRAGRPDEPLVETNPRDIEPSRPSMRAVPYTYSPIYTRSPSPEPYFQQQPQPMGMGIGHPPRIPTMLDDSEELVARASDQDSRDLYAMERAMRRSLAAKRAWETRRGRAAVPIGVPQAPMSSSASSASASAQPGYPQARTPLSLEPDED
jgi:hypothetical protein